jgi:hypothetical protein
LEHSDTQDLVALSANFLLGFEQALTQDLVALSAYMIGFVGHYVTQVFVLSSAKVPPVHASVQVLVKLSAKSG